MMNAAWEMGRKNRALKYEGVTVMIIQDFSASVLRRRKGYDAVKKQLRALGTDYRQIYPASLRVACPPGAGQRVSRTFIKCAG